METPASTPTHTRQQILSLIQDDLINSNLINNLNDIGIDASNYSLNLRKVVLQFMGFQSVSDQVHEKYTDFTLRAKGMDLLHQPQLIDNLALEIYRFLDALERNSGAEKPSNKAIVTSLIKQDLINYKMIHSLGNIQISADNYSLDLARIIFEIMDVETREDIDTIFENYIELSKPVLEMHPSQSRQEIDRLASRICDYLEGYSAITASRNC